MSVGHLEWQLHHERCASAGSAVDIHRPAELLNDAAHDVQPEAQPVLLTGRDSALNGSKIRA